MNVKLPPDLQRLAPFIVVAVLALAGLLLVTRGISGGGGAGANADEVLDRAFGEGPQTAVVNVKAVATADVAGKPQSSLGATYTAAGPVGRGGKADLRVTETRGRGEAVRLRLRSTGERGYVQVGGRWYRLTPAQFSQVFGAGGAAVAGPGFNLRNWIKDPRIAGSTQVDGVDTHEVTGDLDPNAMAADFERHGAGARGRQLTRFLRDAQRGGQVSFYVGKDDGVLRKADVTASYTGQAGEEPMKLTLRFDLGVRDVGRTQSFDAPQGARGGAALAKLGTRQLGALATAVALRPTRDKPRTDKSRERDDSSRKRSERPRRAKRSRQAYVNCVQQATDAAALERCQALLPRR